MDLLLLQAGKNIIVPTTATITNIDTVRRRVRFPLKPNPTSASPQTGRNIAKRGPIRFCSCVVVVTRAVVLMTRVDVTALVLGMVMGVVVKAHEAPVGNPDEHAREMLLV